VGVSYRFLKKFRVEADLTWYFNENAKNEDWIRTNADVDDGYDIGIMLEYMFTDKLLASIGYLHTKVGFQPEDMTPEAPELTTPQCGSTGTSGFAGCWPPARIGLTTHSGIDYRSILYLVDQCTRPNS